MKLETRPYQQRAVRYLRKELKKSKRVLVVAPTGSGKTEIASKLIKIEKSWKKILWIAHRHELIDQAYKSVKDLGLDAGILMGQEEKLRGMERVDKNARVQVASVQTIARRGVPKGVDLIVFDEAHRSMADSYQDIARQRPKALVLGLTATPDRMDGRGLGDFFSVLYNVAEYSELQEQGYLARPRTYTTPSGISSTLREVLKGARTSKGDYSRKSLRKVGSAIIGDVVKNAIALAPDKPKVVFACDVEHSESLTAEFIRKGVQAVHIDATTTAEDRETAIKSLKSGKVEVICNVDVLTEGWDLPALYAVIVARPTKSVARFTQMVGRVQRRYRRQKPIVLDHGGNVERLDIIPGDDIAWTLKSGRPERSKMQPKVRGCEECGIVLDRGSLICEGCGHEHEHRMTEKEERQVIEAELEEVTREKLNAIKNRVEKFAENRNVPKGWKAKVTAELSRS